MCSVSLSLFPVNPFFEVRGKTVWWWRKPLKSLHCDKYIFCSSECQSQKSRHFHKFLWHFLDLGGSKKSKIATELRIVMMQPNPMHLQCTLATNVVQLENQWFSAWTVLCNSNGSTKLFNVVKNDENCRINFKSFLNPQFQKSPKIPMIFEKTCGIFTIRKYDLFG